MTNYNAVIIMQLRCGHVFIIESIGRVLYINNPGNKCMFGVLGLIEERNSTQSECKLTVLSGSGSYRCGSSKESDFKGNAGQGVTLDFSTGGCSIHLQLKIHLIWSPAVRGNVRGSDCSP